MFREMPDQLDDIDLKLLSELERDADRTNVELARLVGLSPAATFNRGRRPKDSGVIGAIVAPAAAALGPRAWSAVSSPGGPRRGAAPRCRFPSPCRSAATTTPRTSASPT